MQDLEPTYAKWIRWLKRVDEDISRLWNNRQVWRDIGQMVRDNPDIPHPAFFLGWLTNLYVGAQVMGIRRQADTDSDVASMARLLSDIEQRPEVLSRDRVQARLEKRHADDPDSAADIVERLEAEFLEPDGSGVSTSLVAADRARLQATASRVRRYANNQFAHLSRNPFKAVPSWDEVNGALDVLGDLLSRYQWLLEAVRRVQVEPVIQDPWQAAFTVPWRRMP